MFRLEYNDKGTLRTIVYNNTLTECLDDYKVSLELGNKADNLSIFYVDKDYITRAKLHAVVCKENDSDDVCAMLEHINGGYIGLFRRGQTKHFKTLDALRDYLFNIDYQKTVIIL